MINTDICVTDNLASFIIRQHRINSSISNRMIGGPDEGITSEQGGAMGESWSDMLAAEYLIEYGFRAPGETPFITGGYVTDAARSLCDGNGGNDDACRCGQQSRSPSESDPRYSR